MQWGLPSGSSHFSFRRSCMTIPPTLTVRQATVSPQTSEQRGDLSWDRLHCWNSGWVRLVVWLHRECSLWRGPTWPALGLSPGAWSQAASSLTALPNSPDSWPHLTPLPAHRALRSRLRPHLTPLHQTQETADTPPAASGSRPGLCSLFLQRICPRCARLSKRPPCPVSPPRASKDSKGFRKTPPPQPALGSLASGPHPLPPTAARAGRLS